MMAYTFLSVFAVFLTVATLSVVGEPSPTMADQSLMKYMLSSPFARNSKSSMLCFNHYIPILNDIADEFSKCYQECAATEQETIDKMNDEALSDRYQVELAADNVCVQMDACNNHKNALDFFDCYSGQGSENSRTLYTVTQNSSILGAELREKYRLVVIDKERCQNASERAYVENTAATYKELDLCLKEDKIPSTPSPTSTSTSTTSTTTSKPAEVSTSTTEASTSRAPEDEPKVEIPRARFFQFQPDFQRAGKIKY